MSNAVSKRKRWKKRPKPYNAPKSEDLDVILGRWKVTKVLYESCVDEGEALDRLEGGSNGVDLSECEGVEVGFDEQCDVTWYIPKGVEPIPLYHTTSFNIEREIMDLIGGEDGKTFRFLIEKGTDEGQLVLKTPIDDSYEEESNGEMVFIIDKVSTGIATIVDNFSLKDALEDGFFSDLTVHSSDGVSFPVHRTVLVSSSPRGSYREWEVLLSGFKATLIKTILEYLYTDSLPVNLSLSLAKELCAAISLKPKLSRLCDLCRAFIESNNLKQRLMGFVDDLQSSLELAKRIVESTEMANPVKVTYAIKQLAKEAAAGAAKVCLMCELYTRNKKEMSKKEKHEVLEYVRGRVVVFVDLLNELIETALSNFTQLTGGQKMEVATYIIPEVERIWDMLNTTSKEVETAMSAKVKSLHTKGGRPHFQKQDIKLSFIFQFIARGKELKRLQRIRKEFEDFVLHSHRKRDEFREWTESEKAEKIVRVMDGLEGEGMNQMEQLSDLKKDILIDNALDWKKFKIMVAVCCSYVSWSLQKAQSFKTPLRPILLKGLKFIQRSDVNDVLLYFELLDEADLKELRDDDQEEEEDLMKLVMPGLQASPSTMVVTENLLAQGCHKLLSSRDYSDMQFVLMPPSSPPPPPLPHATLNGTEEDRLEVEEAGEGVVIPAHRVIVAARCEYFKRALQSGMKEAINKRIVIHDCEESVFHTFLYYLYGGTLDTGAMTTDDIIELMAVADRYETTSLRGMCEGLLVERVEDGNVFGLLQVADHYSARRLREMTLQHIIADPDILMSELDAYSNLPDDLKDEIRKLLSSFNPHLALRHSSGTREIPPVRSDSNSTSDSTNNASSNNSTSGGEPGFDDSYYQTAEVLAFEESLGELRGILGAEPTDDTLREILLAADMDVNRAANFYFS